MRKMIILMVVLTMVMGTSVTSLASEGEPERFLIGDFGGDTYYLTDYDIEDLYEMGITNVKNYMYFKYPVREMISDNVVKREYEYKEDTIVCNEYKEQAWNEITYYQVPVIGVNKKGEYARLSLELTPHYQRRSTKYVVSKVYALVD